MQIAYDHLTPKAKTLFNRYNAYLADNKRSLVASAAWMDTLRRPDQLWMQPMHYINTPYAPDHSVAVKPPNRLNAPGSIQQAQAILEQKQASNYDLGFNLRVLLHVVGDIHQPMHAVSLYNKTLPNGDKGGNLYRLKANTVGENLHTYWDRGGGYLSRNQRYSYKMLRRLAKTVERRWPCSRMSHDTSVQQWANESWRLAVDVAYQTPYNGKPSKDYRLQTRKLSEQRIAQAGCRLADMLNNIALA